MLNSGTFIHDTVVQQHLSNDTLLWLLPNDCKITLLGQWWTMWTTIYHMYSVAYRCPWKMCVEFCDDQGVCACVCVYRYIYTLWWVKTLWKCNKVFLLKQLIWFQNAIRYLKLDWWVIKRTSEPQPPRDLFLPLSLGNPMILFNFHLSFILCPNTVSEDMLESSFKLTKKARHSLKKPNE